MAFTPQELEIVRAEVTAEINSAYYNTPAETKRINDLADEIISALLNHKTISNFRNKDYLWAISTAFGTLFSQTTEFTENDHLLLQSVKGTPLYRIFMEELFEYLAEVISNTKDENLLTTFTKQMEQKGYSIEEILMGINNRYFNPWENDYPILLKNVKNYITTLLPQHINSIVKEFNIHRETDSNIRALLPHLAQHTEHNLLQLLQYKDYNNVVESIEGYQLLAHYGHKIHKQQILTNINQAVKKQLGYPTSGLHLLVIYRTLENHYPGEFSNQIVSIATQFLEDQRKGKYLHVQGQWNSPDPNISLYDYDELFNPKERWTYFSHLAIYSLLKHTPETAKEYLQNYLIDVPASAIHAQSLEIIGQKLQADVLPLLAPYFKKIKGIEKAAYQVLMNLFSTHDPQHTYTDRIWEASKDKTRHIQQSTAGYVAQLGETILPKIEVSLKDKSAAVRQCMALALSKINTPKAMEMLNAVFHTEKDDDARDLMMQALGEKQYQNLSYPQMDMIINYAEQRGKLAKPAAEWMQASELPELFYKNETKVPVQHIQFLFYRMGRTKDIRTDIEARLILDRIDKTKTNTFVQALYKRFIDNGGEAKYKYILTIVGLLADDDWAAKLKTDIPKWVDASRGKMAEYGVKALALQGSNKALRAVEFFSRKYRAKNKNVGTAALEALEVAAEELGMDINQLADSIIPDFGFENMYRSFEVDGQEYRAFIAKDFKMMYLNEAGKILKSPPKNTDKELLAEFKEIAKEIRDVVKSQSSRMELYLVIQRRWEAEVWQGFFLHNPIMFVYATTLLWGEFDAQGNLLQTFYVNEDTEKLDLEDNEIELTQGNQIGMVHPLLMDEEALEQWQRKFYELEIEPVFAQLKRHKESLPKSLYDQTEITEFNGKTIDALKFNGYLRRQNWAFFEIGDGGGIWSVYKPFSNLGIYALLHTGGDFSVGYYDGDAEIGNLEFHKEDEKNTILTLKEVPEIIYSEVMTELKALFPEKSIEQ